MPSATINEDSALLTLGGWIAATSDSGVVRVLGADRHGSIVERIVRKECSSLEDRCAFIGTRTSFGFVSASTRLLDAGGRPRHVAEVIDKMSITKVHFETLTESDRVNASHEAVTSLWQSIARGAAAVGKNRIALRCRTRQPSRGSTGPKKCHSVSNYGTQTFCLIERESFITALAAGWPPIIDKLAQDWLSNEEQNLQLGREEFIFGLWLVSSRRFLRNGFRLQYDGLQHTSCIYLSNTEQIPSPVQPGACAFYSATKRSPVTLLWDDPSWNPICCGFLLCGT